MDLGILNDGQVESKPWLNPVCNVIRCNSLIAGSIIGGGAEACSYTNAVQINGISGTTLTTGINSPILASPNFNTATSVYTVAIAGVYRVSISCTVGTNVAGINNFQLQTRINGAFVNSSVGACQSTVPATFCRNTATSNWLGQLAVGNTIGFQLQFIGTDPNANIAGTTCMFIVEKL